jgi:hypothetical protein
VVLGSYVVRHASCVCSAQSTGGAAHQAAKNANHRRRRRRRRRREDLQAFNAGLTADEGVPAIGDGQLDFSLRLFDLNQVRPAALESPKPTETPTPHRPRNQPADRPTIPTNPSPTTLPI